MANGDPGFLDQLAAWVQNSAIATAWWTLVGAAMGVAATVLKRVRRTLDPNGAFRAELETARQEQKNRHIELRGDISTLAKHMATYAEELSQLRQENQRGWEEIGKHDGQIEQLQNIVDALGDHYRELKHLPDQIGTLEQRLAARDEESRGRQSADAAESEEEEG